MDPDEIGTEDIYAALDSRREHDPAVVGDIDNPAGDAGKLVSGQEGARNSMEVSTGTTAEHVLVDDTSNSHEVAQTVHASRAAPAASSPRSSRGAAAADTEEEVPNGAAYQESVDVDRIGPAQNLDNCVVADAISGDDSAQVSRLEANNAHQRVASQTESSPYAGSSSATAEDSARTDADERSFPGGNEERYQESDTHSPDHSNNLATQLRRLWRGPPPNQAEELTVMRDILGHREELDDILSKLMTAKRSEPGLADRVDNGSHPSGVVSPMPSSAAFPRPFTLATLSSRFAPAVTDPSELRERSRARVRVVTAAGLRVGLAKRVFAREPLLPSDVEVEEEQQSRLQTGASPSPIDIEDLRALVVPVRASATAAPEMSPEGGPLPYPSMSEVSSLMWCEYDDDDGSGGNSDSTGERSGAVRGEAAVSGDGGRQKQRLRISVQTLDGRVCDDEEEDSETDDGDSDADHDKNDRENETDEDSGNEGSFVSARGSKSVRQERKRSDARGASSRRASGAKGARKAADGVASGKRSTVEEDELDEIAYQRKEELASALRKLRAAVRLTDGVLTEDKVRWVAKRMARVAAMTALTSELITTTAARSACRGLGDRIRLERQRARGGGGRRGVRWVTVYVGVGRWGRNYFGPGFAVETQDKYRLGWLSLSSRPATEVVGERGGPSGTATAGQHGGRESAAGTRPSSRVGRRGFFGLGRRARARRSEVDDSDADVEGWVGSLTCNYCDGHPLDERPAVQRSGKRHTAAAAPGDEKSDKVSEDEVFFQAEETDGATLAQALGRPGVPDVSASAGEAAAGNVEAISSTGITMGFGSSARSASHSMESSSSRSGGCGGVDGGNESHGRWDGGEQANPGEVVEEEEWCGGHVCLRLRPDGLRERRRGGRRTRDPQREAGDNMGESSEDGSGSDADSGSALNGENVDSPDGTVVDGTKSVGSSHTSTSSGVGSRDGVGVRRSGTGMPLSSITKGVFAGDRRDQADSCGISSDKSSKSLEAFAWGDNTGCCLGLPVNTSAGLLPRALRPFGLLPGERIVAVACSERHTLLVTGMGSVYSAGDGTDGALGLGGPQSTESFRLIEWFAEQMPTPKLCKASAGSDLIGCHSAALDANGRLFTWGVGAAAGHASLKPVLLPREVESLGGFGTGTEARDADGGLAGLKSRVKGVACGGGFTLAVTNGGKVFAWGSWARGRLGLGRPPERTTGRKKKVPRFQATPQRVYGLGRSPVVQVAAGAWHGMALTGDGEVYTWGHNASGQLGFLVLPSAVSEHQQHRHQTEGVQASTAATSTASLSEMLRASWTPVKLPSFGKGLSDFPVEPLRAPMAGAGMRAGPGYHGSKRGVRQFATHIACGPEHSIAVDSHGTAWTWGAEGRACLGQGEAGFGAPGEGTAVTAEAQARAMGLPGDEDRRQQRIFIPLSREREVSRARARRALIGGWAVPRRIACLAPTASPLTKTAASNTAGSAEGEGGTAGYVNEEASAAIEMGGVGAGENYGAGGDSSGGAKIVAAAAGFRHTVLVTHDGRMYLFGEGSAVAGGDLSALEGKGAAALRDSGGLVRHQRSEEQGKDQKERPDAVEALSAVAGPTPVPKEVCSAWFPTLAGRRVSAVACAGQHVIVVLAGDHIGYTLGMSLFRAAMGTDRHSFIDAGSEGDMDDRRDGNGIPTRAKGGVDCELLVGGSYLHGHRVVLASRSPVLRDMIAQEERPGEDSYNGGGSDDWARPPLQLLLPDIRFEVARALLEFLYTGELRRSLFDLGSPLPYDLRAAAKSYGAPRLEALCTEAISLAADPGRHDGGDGDGGEEGWGKAVPPPSLAGDLGGALGTMEHADVKFVAGGRPIYAHRVLLSCESEYFAAMFRFRDQKGQDGIDIPHGTKEHHEGHATAMAEIVVPDSYSGFVRLLLYIYTGVLPDSGPESLLEDMMSADRYRLLGMKRVCQSMLRLSADSCLQALQAAEMVNAPRLRQAALFHAEHNLSQVSQQEGFQDVIAGTASLAEVLLCRLHASATNASAVSSAMARQKRLQERVQKQRADGSGQKSAGLGPGYGEDLSFRADSPFPWGAALVAVVCAAVYFKLSNVVAVGIFVPVVNSVFFVGLAVFAIHKLRDKGVFETERGKVRRMGQQRRAGGGAVARKVGAWKGRTKGAVGGRRGGSTYLFG